MAFLLALPAIVVTAVFFVIWFGIEDVPGEASDGGDWWRARADHRRPRPGHGRAGRDRVQGPDSGVCPGCWCCWASPRWCRSRATRPRTPSRWSTSALASPGQWPVQLTAFLFGMSVLGAQIPLSTFARTDPDIAGYGLGADASFVSTLIGVYVVFLAIGAFTLPLTSRLLGPRGALVLGALLVALGYALWLPFHDSTGQALVNMAIAGVGSGALVAALPATAAAAAPPDRTGFATGMTNATKTVGGAIASSIFAICLASARLDRRPGQGPGPAVRLPHRVGHLRRGRPARGGGAAADAEGGDLAPSGDHRVTQAPLYFGGVPQSDGRPDDRSEERSRPAVRQDGKAAARARIAQQHTWVDLQVRQAMERGDFDDLPGKGKPIADLGEQPRPELVAQEAGGARAHRRAATQRGPAQGGRRARRHPRQAQRRGRRTPPRQGLQRARDRRALPAPRGATAGDDAARRRRDRSPPGASGVRRDWRSSGARPARPSRPESPSRARSAAGGVGSVPGTR